MVAEVGISPSTETLGLNNKRYAGAPETKSIEACNNTKKMICYFFTTVNLLRISL
jgi:hypothetical protein